MSDKYYSQYGQDKYLDKEIFRGRAKGFFVEIGANDGITYSNTFFFELYRNWTGLCIEPHPLAFAKLEKNRNCKSLNIGISDRETELEFIQIEGYAEMLSGLRQKYDSQHLERIQKEIEKHGGEMQSILISCKRLETVLQDNNIDHVDYCSIDVEGGELEILESAGLSKCPIDVLSVENNYYRDKLKKYLKSCGYKLKTTIECDEIYVKRKTRFYFLDWI